MATKRPKKPRRLTIPKLVDKAWALTSQFVRLEASEFGGYCKCITCPYSFPWDSGAMHAGHYYHGKSHCASYLYLPNIHPQCHQCNYFGKGKPREYALYLEKNYPPGILQDLYEQYKSSKRWERGVLNDLIVERRAQIRDLGGTPCR